MLCSINPTSGGTISFYEEMVKDRISKIIEKAYHTFLSWNETDSNFRRLRMKKKRYIYESNFLDPQANVQLRYAIYQQVLTTA